MDHSPCSLDSNFAAEIKALLSPPPPESVKEYYDNLIKARKCQGIKVNARNLLGKGVYAIKEFTEGELVLKDQMLVAAQHTSNKVDCLVCSYCFRYIGSIELQIGRKLYLQYLGVSNKNKCDHQGIANNAEECIMDSSEEDNPIIFPSNGTWTTSSNLKHTPIPKEILESLMNGGFFLPHTDKFPLPPVIGCLGGCEEEHYCSKRCAEHDWEEVHSLLCTGKNAESSRRASLLKFIDHANRTNDIFILAAKAISSTILKYKQLKNVHVNQHRTAGAHDSDISNFSLLLETWKPISMGFKKRWWNCVALPDDVDPDDESSFRRQIKDLAFTSLQLLKEAIFEQECAPLFSLEIYGHIIGMFELNNLDLVVASPVEDYFIYIDELPSPNKEEAEKLTRPLLDAIGEEYSACCQGTAFFPLQSCMNHSCRPNAKAFKREEDRDGQATIIALRTISKDEEITISYIDEDLTYDERQALLADYGFRCRCSKCSEEAEELSRSSACFPA